MYHKDFFPKSGFPVLVFWVILLKLSLHCGYKLFVSVYPIITWRCYSNKYLHHHPEEYIIFLNEWGWSCYSFLQFHHSQGQKVPCQSPLCSERYPETQPQERNSTYKTPSEVYGFHKESGWHVDVLTVHGLTHLIVTQCNILQTSVRRLELTISNK